MPRKEFIQQSEMAEKEQVGCLLIDYQFIVILIDQKSNIFHLIGAADEEKAKALTRAVQFANRYLEMQLIASRFKIELLPKYLNYMVQSCNSDLKFFEMKIEMLANDKEYKILKHLLTRCQMIEHISFKNFRMSEQEIELVTQIIITLPQHQLKSIRFINCQISDHTLPLLGRMIKHNGFLDYLAVENASITDKSLRFFTGLWQYIPFLQFFSLTKCQYFKGEIYLSSFIEKIVTELQLKHLILSHNSLTAAIEEQLAEELFCLTDCSIETLDLSHNKITPRENWVIYQHF